MERGKRHTFSWKLTSLGKEPPRRMGKPSGSEMAFWGKLIKSHLTSR